MVRKLEQNFIWSSHVLRPIAKDIKGIMAFGHTITDVLFEKLIPGENIDIIYATALNLLKLSFEFSYKHNFKYFNLNGCYFNIINILCYNFLLHTEVGKFIKKVGFILSNCYLIGILDLS